MSIFSPFVATLSKPRSPEKGKVWCEFTGERGEACESQQNPQAFSATTREGQWANPGDLVTLLFPLMAAMQYEREKGTTREQRQDKPRTEMTRRR